MPDDRWFKIYTESHNNAVNLLSEAEILRAKEKFARAYFLAFTGLEEVAKSQLAADVFTGFITEEEFWACYREHKRKIGRMAWASEEGLWLVSLAECDSRFIDTISRPSRSANWSISLICESMLKTCLSLLSVDFRAYRQYFTSTGGFTAEAS